MAKGKTEKNGANKKLHSKLIKRKKNKLQEAKELRKRKLKEISNLLKQKESEDQ